MDLKALFTISHGLYLTGARDDRDRLIGSCVDSVMVVEADPASAQVMVSLNKQSYTAQTVLKTKRLTLSVLPETVNDDVIRTFGMQSSRTADKWANQPVEMMSDLPVWQPAVAVMVLQVANVIETKGHYVLLCDVEVLRAGSMEKPLTYNEYQNRKEKKMSETKKWVCSICGYVYEGEIPFEELPEDWVCPLCGEPKSVFVQE